MQDCSTLDPIHPTPVEEAYCVTLQMVSEPSMIARGCIGILEYSHPKWHLPKPPVGGAVCVDIDTDDRPPQKVFNE